MKKLTFLVVFTFIIKLTAQDLPAYSIYDSKGRRVSFKKMTKSLQAQDVVLFGEYHDNPISHWLQLELTAELYSRRQLILGTEMIETDNQEALSLYLNDSISQKGLDTLARLWNNYKTDYKPLVDFAKENRLHVVASNIPRKYARLVNRKGMEALDTLSPEERKWMAPLPIKFDPELPMYKQMREMMGEHASPDIVKAQAIKDATMAHFILKNYKADHLFLHINGSFHSDFHEGIFWYLKQNVAMIKCATISTVLQKDVKKLEKEHQNRADFIIVVDEDMTRTF